MSIRDCLIWGVYKTHSPWTLTHWGRVTHICVGKLTIIGSDNGLSPGRRQSIIWTNAGLLLIGPLGTNFSEILIEIPTFSFKKMRLKVSSAKWRPFCLGFNVLKFRGITEERCARCAFHFNSFPPWTKWPPFGKTTISNAFSWMEMIEFRNLLPGVQLTISQQLLR